MWWGLLVADRRLVVRLVPLTVNAYVLIENSFARCTKCKAVVKDTETVLDAIRIGQEALEKATRVQLSGSSPELIR